MTTSEPYEAGQEAARQDFLSFACDLADGATPPPQRTVRAVATAAGDVTGDPMKALRATAKALKPIQNHPLARKVLKWK